MTIYKNKNKIPKIVFSGGPGVGKTSILQELKSLGYDVRNEVFTSLFSQAQKENSFEDLFENKQLLINTLIKMQEKEEEEYKNCKNRHTAIFLDRGMIDIYGFSKEIKYELSEQEIFAMQSFYYDFVFIPEPLGKNLYVQNSIRRQTYEESLERHKQCVSAYISFFGSKNQNPKKHIIFVPHYFTREASSVKNRIDFVLKKIQEIFREKI